MPIYTKTGDAGETSLFGGKRVLKCNELVDVYGSIDELNSHVGSVVSELDDKEIGQFLQTVQSDLFTIGSTLAGWKADVSDLDGRISEMERRIDAIEKQLPELTNFILPGGTSIGAHVHVVRSICRRVERQTVALKQTQTVDPILIKYLNRLSDLFFDLARYINSKAHVGEIVWSGIPRDAKLK